MELSLKPPLARYKVIKLTIPGRHDQLELGPVLAATYNRQEFEILYPFRAVVKPLSWEIIETFGALESPDAALWRYMSKQVAALVISQNFDKMYGERYGGDGAVALEPPRKETPEAEPTEELLEREVGAR